NGSRMPLPHAFPRSRGMLSCLTLSMRNHAFKNARPFAMRSYAGLTALIISALLLSQPGLAQNADSFPTRPVKLVVPFPPGGPTDVMARLFGQKLSERWGQPVVIENRPGGNSAIGAQQIAKSVPDGYALLVAMDVTLVMNPITTRNLPYDALKDFV